MTKTGLLSLTAQIMLCIFIIFSCGCGGGDVMLGMGTGSINFSLQFEHSGNSRYLRASPASDVCVDYGIDRIVAVVYDSDNTEVEREDWSCIAHEGSIDELPAGIMSLELEGKINGIAKWKGQKSNITLIAGQVHDVGKVIMNYMGSDNISPTVVGHIPYINSGEIAVGSNLTVTFSENMALSSINDSTIILEKGSTVISAYVSYASDTKTATVSLQENLSYSTAYTVTVTTDVMDMAGNNMDNNYSWNFTTTEKPYYCSTPGAAESPDPYEAQTSVSIDADLDWTDCADTDSYDVYFGKSSDPPYYGSSTTSDYTLPDLEYNTQYYWKITAKNDCGNRTSSKVWDFTTGDEPCPIPATASNPDPSDGMTGETINADLDWADCTDTDSYDVYFGTSSDPSYYGNTTESSYSLSELDYSTQYYWKIVAKNDCGNSASSNVWAFTTGDEPDTCPIPGAAAINADPYDGQTGESINADLHWTDCANTNSYDVYFGTSSDPPYYGNTTESSYSLSELDYNTKYYWKIVAKNDCGNSTSSNVWDFTTEDEPDTCSTPGAASNPDPSDGMTGESINADLDWADCTDTDSYDVYFGTSSDPPYYGSTTASSYSLSELDYNTQYYWKIVAKNDCGNSIISNVWNFTTEEFDFDSSYEMVYISSGTFMMGSPSTEAERHGDYETLHQVTLTKGFYLGTGEVTQGQWKAIMGNNNPSYFNTCGDDCPVEQVSWNDCQAFIEKLNQQIGVDKYRLPTEAEWEYACRAGTETPFHFGLCLSTDQANYNGNYPYTGCAQGIYRGETIAVNSFSPNAWGLYGMHDNVEEWCQDWFEGSYPTDSVIDPQGPLSSSNRISRGGSWANYAGNSRSAMRHSHLPDYMTSGLGFRLARTP